MKLVVDENIVQGKEAFEKFGDVSYLGGRNISNESLIDIDALIVRSITKVNEELLNNTKVKFVGTATIGTDHIDLEYLEKKNINFSSAAGCNSYSVAEYVFSAITKIATENNLNLSDKSIGVIGYGNIGTKVVKIANALGMKTVINDPPKERVSKEKIFSPLEDALACDIVTFHVPLNIDGVDKTVHLLDERNIELIRENSIIINSSRGPVISNKILKERLEKKNNIYAVLDVWEEEPIINLQLLDLVNIATPHIAGYSFEGKVNGTKIVYDALCKSMDKTPEWKPILDSVSNNLIEISKNENNLKLLEKLFAKSYPIIEDDYLMRKLKNISLNEIPQYFDGLRKNYKTRRELNNFEVLLSGKNELLENLLSTLRVKLK
jgi:erythronate-4-phosphate dehydrogenase